MARSRPRGSPVNRRNASYSPSAATSSARQDNRRKGRTGGILGRAPHRTCTSAATKASRGARWVLRAVLPVTNGAVGGPTAAPRVGGHCRPQRSGLACRAVLRGNRNPSGAAMLNDSQVEANIPASDLKRAREFYADKLGLTPTQEFGEEALAYRTAGGTAFNVYRTEYAGKAEHTIAQW